MSKRPSTASTSIGWIDVVAILAVIAILSFALGEIATGRVRDWSLRARMDEVPRVAAAPANAPEIAKEPAP